MINQIIIIGYFVCSIICVDGTNVTNSIYLNRKIRQTSGCVLPPHPRNGQWSLLGGSQSPGDTVPANSVLEFKCNNYYKLSKNKHAICVNGWIPQLLPECEALCSPRFSTTTTFLQCFNKLGEEISCKEATHGSYLNFNCGPFYEPTPGHKKSIYCVEGVWSSVVPECRPICGFKNDAMPLLYGGTSLTKLTYPWAVAIYKKDEGDYFNLCGGTIIHRKVVLTAAHCVADEFGIGYPVQNYAVTAGKIYYKYKDTRDKDVQYLQVTQFIVHPQYKDNSRRFLADIALVVTQLPFKLNSLVRPICINDLNTIYLHPGAIGEVAGWGVTETGQPADELKFLKIPHTYNEDCVKELPIDWADKYNIIDKMCAGSPEKKISVCKGDSGSGLSFKNVEDNRYYVHGIVSLAPSTKTGDTCNIYTNALYTKVSFYYEFIDLAITRLNWCKLPNYPKNGKWQLPKFPNKIPGEIVSPFDILEVSCDVGYNLMMTNSTVDCETLLQNPPYCKAASSVVAINTINQKPPAPLDTNKVTTNQLGIQMKQKAPTPSNSNKVTSNQLENQMKQKPTSPSSLSTSKVTKNQLENQTRPTPTASLNIGTDHNDRGDLTILVSRRADSGFGYLLITRRGVRALLLDLYANQNFFIGIEQCGVRVDGSKSTIYNTDGELVKHTDYPWLVTLYQGRSFIGHGNILTKKLVITGARDVTVWNVWTLLDAKEVSVGTGKYFRFVHDPREPDAKYYDAEKIFIYEKFKGISDGLFGDIGFVVVKKSIEFNNWVGPICIQGVNEIFVKPGMILEITGWTNSDNKFTDTPRTDQVLMKKIGTCLQETSSLSSYLSQDALCGGPVDNTTCIRHNGAGLVYKKPEDNRYYLTAMYGFGVTGCGAGNNFYISMKYHYDYVMEQVRKYN